MKKHWYILAVMTTVIFTSCNKDEEITEETNELKVLEYCPAPGQFINEGFNCQTMQEANAYAEQRFKQKNYVSLGSFGGYITVKMPKEIKNRKGYDFGIIGNPFDGSSEPGIVWVSEDANGNGKADDVWYELKGSDNPTRDYSVTYFRPDEIGDIPWEDSEGEKGVIKSLSQYHAQMYYPNWIKEDSYTLTGSMLEPYWKAVNGKTSLSAKDMPTTGEAIWQKTTTAITAITSLIWTMQSIQTATP